jgi:hypothetical protein
VVVHAVVKTLLCPLLLLLPSTVLAQAQASYVGNESCRTCHVEAFEAWRASPHARATVSLTGKSGQDGRCLSCHAPQADKGVASVGCESCHGAGALYSPRYVMKDAELSRAVGLEDPGEKSCRVCHDASSPSLKPFDFKQKLPLIDHWTAERQKKQAQLQNRQLLEQALGLAVEPGAKDSVHRAARAVR